MKNKILITLVLGLFLVGIVSANSFNFFGTYYLKSGIYVNSNGEHFSTKNIPFGTKLNFKEDIPTTNEQLCIDFYFSENCPHCRAIFPYVKEVSKNYKINFYDINKGSYNVKAVPTIKIKTTDCRNINLVGSYETSKYLKCEIQEKSTKECPTLTELNSEKQSWFIEE